MGEDMYATAEVVFRQKLGGGTYCFDITLIGDNCDKTINVGMIFVHLKKKKVMMNMLKNSKRVSNPEKLEELKAVALEAARTIDEFIK